MDIDEYLKRRETLTRYELAAPKTKDDKVDKNNIVWNKFPNTLKRTRQTYRPKTATAAWTTIPLGNALENRMPARPTSRPFSGRRSSLALITKDAMEPGPTLEQLKQSMNTPVIQIAGETPTKQLSLGFPARSFLSGYRHIKPPVDPESSEDEDADCDPDELEQLYEELATSTTKKITIQDKTPRRPQSAPLGQADFPARKPKKKDVDYSRIYQRHIMEKAQSGDTAKLTARIKAQERADETHQLYIPQTKSRLMRIFTGCSPMVRTPQCNENAQFVMMNQPKRLYQFDEKHARLASAGYNSPNSSMGTFAPPVVYSTNFYTPRPKQTLRTDYSHDCYICRQSRRDNIL